MIEAYAFFGVFMAQILATSVLYPAWFSRYVRLRAAHLPVERVEQLYPGVDLSSAHEPFLSRYRALHTGIALLGLLLLIWLFGYMRRPDWHPDRVVFLVTVYFFAAQLLPLGMVIWRGVRFNKDHKRSLPDAKRTAVLQRRGLFNFVSKPVVSVAVLGYFLFAAFAIYIRRDPIAGRSGLIILGAITLVYALTAFVVYTMLYGRKGKNTLDTHADRLQAIGVTVKSSVYTCIVIAVYLSLNLSLALLNLQKWQPLALSIFFLICALLSSMGVTATLRRARLIDRPT